MTYSKGQLGRRNSVSPNIFAFLFMLKKLLDRCWHGTSSEASFVLLIFDNDIFFKIRLRNSIVMKLFKGMKNTVILICTFTSYHHLLSSIVSFIPVKLNCRYLLKPLGERHYQQKYTEHLEVLEPLWWDNLSVLSCNQFQTCIRIL